MRRQTFLDCALAARLLHTNAGKTDMTQHHPNKASTPSARRAPSGRQPVGNLTKAVEIYHRLLSHIDQRSPDERASTISAIGSGLQRIERTAPVFICHHGPQHRQLGKLRDPLKRTD